MTATAFDQALALYRRNRKDTAARLCGEILRDDPAHWRAAHLLGVIRLEAGAPGEALPHLRQAAESGAAPALAALGSALRALGRAAEAEAAARAACAADPARPEYPFNLGNILGDRGDLEGAAAAFRQALALAPDMVAAHFNLASVLLKAGHFAEGFAEYEWRWRRPGSPQHFHTAAPGWDGAPYPGRTLLVHAEQGLGDVINFARHLPETARRGGRLVVEAPQPLLRLLQSSFPDIEMVAKAADGPTPVPPFDLQAALPSLPGILGVRVDGIPAAVPYLRPAPGTPDPLADLGEGAGGGLRVGLVWGSSANDPSRDLPLAGLAAALDLPGVTPVSLQVGPHAAALATTPEAAGILDGGARLGDFHDTAAAMNGLDLIVSVDTAAAHLAGALGRPLLLLLPHLAGWRWLIGRDDSPWYPTTRLLRQPAPGDWGAVLAAVRAHVAAFAALPAAERRTIRRP